MYSFTIIIPHYNIHQLLKRLLSTIPKRSDVQVIVIDDCSSTDRNQLRQLQAENSWVEWYSTGINGGGGKARNIGLQHASGKYVIFADSDDFFLPSINEILDEYKDKEFDICYFPAISLDTDTFYPALRGIKLREKILEGISNNDPSLLKFESTVPWGKIIKRKIITDNEISFEESIISNDVAFSTLVDLNVKKCLIDKRCMYCITDRTNSVSRDLSPERALIRLKIDTARIELLKENGIKKKILFTQFVRTLNSIIKSKDSDLYQQANRYMKMVGYDEKDIKIGLQKAKYKVILIKMIRRIIPLRLRKMMIQSIDNL